MFIVAPSILKSTQFTHKQMHYLLAWLRVLNLHTIISLLHHSTQHTTHMPFYSLALHCTQHTCRSAVSLCTAHNTHAALRHAATSSNLYNDVIVPSVLT